MSTRCLITLFAVMTIGLCDAGAAAAQTSPRGQATSPGQSRAKNRLPQAASGGVPTGLSASGPETEGQRKARARAKKATEICKGC